jgi:Arf-GAP with coiled-coil, ANK repeat and PH domain-containing protein
MLFKDLQDSPAFRACILELETGTERFYKQRHKRLVAGTKKYVAGLEASYQSTLEFVDALDSFCGGTDEESSTVGGPTLQRFAHTFRELASFHELLRTQVEIIICDRLNDTVTGLVTDMRQARKQFDQRSSAYDAVRGKALGHRKSWGVGGKASGVDTDKEQALAVARAASEESRFDFARKLSAV